MRILYKRYKTKAFAPSYGVVIAIQVISWFLLMHGKMFHVLGVFLCLSKSEAIGKAVRTMQPRSAIANPFVLP